MDMVEDKKGKEKYDDYDCQHFAETLIKAEQIKNDPKKMEAAQKHIKKQKKAIESINDLKAVRKEKMENDNS